MEKNNIIFDYQSGFRTSDSCETLINFVISNWKVAVHDKKIIIAIFLDLRRAFETIDKNILIQKLEKYGLKNVELRWFESYLFGRTQRTRVDDKYSEAVDVNLGVPQGAILGVVLFLIYINDICKSISDAIILLFADDALLYVEQFLSVL